MPSTTLYGNTQCDTVKAARRWLDAEGIAYRFHDLRADGIDADVIARWIQTVGWEALVNRRGTTWRTLDPATRAGLDAASVVATLRAHPTLIKRPVLELGTAVAVGFDPIRYQKLLRISPLQPSANPQRAS